MSSSIPKPTWPDCNGEVHFSTATCMWKRGMEWRKCKRCDRHAEDAVQFGSKITNVYCQACTCNECGIELERYEETTCQVCMEKHEESQVSLESRVAIGSSTLHSPDMSEAILRVREIIHSKGTVVSGCNREEYAHGAFLFNFCLGNSGHTIGVSWSHVEQCVFIYMDRGRSGRKRGRFGHVSTVLNRKSYWKRIEKWLLRNVEFSQYEKAGASED